MGNLNQWFMVILVSFIKTNYVSIVICSRIIPIIDLCKKYHLINIY